MAGKRQASVRRKTKETDVEVKIILDGTGKSKIATGVGFLDHMLSLFAHHGLFDLKVAVTRQDLDVDIHHTNEDVGIGLGMAVRKALGSAHGINRMGWSFVPMDEALTEVRTVLDVSGRPAFHFRRKRGLDVRSETGGYSLGDAREFLRAFAVNCGLTLHVDILQGEDAHHIVESVFKALGRALDEAVRIDRRRRGVPSTKGKLIK